MPKIVDPEQRRRHIVAAVFRVIARDGAAHASLRSIAAEAELATGSVRHYCGSRQEIREMALEELTRGFEARFRGHLEDLEAVRAGTLSRRNLLTRMLEEFLPLDRARRDEAAVWLEFSVAARTDEEFAPYVARLRRGMHEVIERVLAGAARSGVLRDGIDEDVEADRLAALLDGLTLRCLEAGGLSTDRARVALGRHLDQLLRPGAD
ncbi:TetR/AcrR family transcriptional regulator [Brachybacterium sacelli]|uniref:AcrR family transcriptional regulator n=1 Tax=Brachybacterium sacelli TaxID=173364 RepID=A0ABS4X061_9MICO|nr:TetR family transcriptional regulator C-terminal domain-containing protein [Brachybacterium sacelli]MBP2381623.1 AcrR family transcriptional regulator [Brachybacterium sacelli]